MQPGLRYKIIGVFNGKNDDGWESQARPVLHKYQQTLGSKSQHDYFWTHRLKHFHPHVCL